MHSSLAALLLLSSAQVIFGEERQGRFAVHRRDNLDPADLMSSPAAQPSVVVASIAPSPSTIKASLLASRLASSFVSGSKPATMSKASSTSSESGLATTLTTFISSSIAETKTTSTSMPALTPSQTQAATPVCTGSPTKWAPIDPLRSVIPIFCADAEKQVVQDPGSGSTVRTYLTGNDIVDLSIDWPSGDPWKPLQDDCIRHLSAIVDDCDIDASRNPMRWKHGGYSMSGPAKYNIVPIIQRTYMPGTCSFQLHEYNSWNGYDSPGHARTNQLFQLKDSVKDDSGAIVSTEANYVVFGDHDAYVCDSFYAPLYMTAEAGDGNYTIHHRPLFMEND